MTLSLTYDGVDLGDAVLLDAIDGLTQNADGTYATGGLSIDDPDGALTYVELQEFIATESACSRDRIFTGFLSNQVIKRGPYKAGAGRVNAFDLLDLNYLLHLQPLRGAEAKRPIESGDDRMAWLLGSVALDGIVMDNGFVGSNPNMFDEADYTLQYADAVLQDLCVSSSAEVGRIFFVYRDSTTGEPSLFMDLPTAAVYTSTLAISNDPADIDDVTTFEPYLDSELQASAEDIYCSVFFKWKGGTTYRHNDTTHATYFAGKGYHRQAVFETTRVGNATTAIRHADSFLQSHSGELRTINCTVRLPKSKVNLIEAGMRVSSKFVHLPGYEAFSYLRVSSRTVRLTSGRNDFYDVHLTLSNRSLTPVGGGGTGDFPHPDEPAAVVQTGCGSSLGGAVALVFPSPITVGHMLVAWIVSRGGSTEVHPPDSSWTQVAHLLIDGESPSAMYYKVADATEDGQTSLGFLSDNGASRPKILGWELTGVESPTDYVTHVPAAGTSFSLPSLTVGTGMVIVGIGTGSDSPEPASITPSDHFYAEAGDHFWQTALGADDLVTPGSISYAIAFTSSGGTLAHVGVAAFFPASSSVTPPTSGQWVFGETVTMAGAVGTTEFPYASGSLRVKVDGVLISPASYTETDPAAGTFTLSWTPDTDETVTVDYQGI